MQNWAATTKMLQEKEKEEKHTEKVIRKNQRKKVPIYSELNVIEFTGQRKSFYRQRIPEYSCTRKETVDMHILIISRNGARKIMQSIRKMSRPPTRIRKWNQSSHHKWTSTRVIPIEKTRAGYISTMNQGFKRGRKWRTNSPIYPFL